jgi:RHS repeat-associated protein
VFLWDGLRLLQEQRGTQAAVYVNETNSYIPVARIDSAAGGITSSEASAGYAIPKGSTYYFHCDVSGLPEELTAASGDIAWRAQYKVWGNTAVENWTVEQDGTQVQEEQPLPQNLRFQGQYLDRESGLHYNTFRYYDPDIGRFISPDPIGLAGGINLYQYAPNPVGWSDPFGLAGLPDVVRYKPRAEMAAQPGARGTAIDRAWVQEKTLIEKTGMGTRDCPLCQYNLRHLPDII